MEKLYGYPHTPLHWDDIDHVVFDIGNVLLSFDPRRMLKSLFPGQDALQNFLLHKVFLSPCWVMLDRSVLTREEIVSRMAAGDEAHLQDIHRAVFDWVDLHLEIPEGVAAMKACREHGKKTYLLTNYNKDAFLETQEKFPFLSQVDGLLVSGREHILKPSLEIYDRLTRRYDLNPARTLFIDDSAGNIEGALAYGWNGFCYQHPGSLNALIEHSI